jgi:putative membrane protein
MNKILNNAISAALMLSAAALATLATSAGAQTGGGSNTGASSSGGATTGGPNQPGMPMGPTKAGPNAAVTGSSTAAGNSGAAAPAPTASSGGATPSPASAAGKPSSNTGPTKAALSRADRTFMEKAAMAGIAEVETGKLAVSNGGHPDVKKFGEHMQQDHSKANDELKAIAGAKGVKLPEAPDRTHQRLAKQLQGLTGDKFDKLYAREAGVKDHKATVALFSRQAQGGSDPDVKAFAAKTLPKLQEHLQMAQAMHDSVMAPAKK